MAANGHANGDAAPKLKYTPLDEIPKVRMPSRKSMRGTDDSRQAHQATERAFLSGKTRSYEWRYNVRTPSSRLQKWGTDDDDQQLRQMGYMIQENEERWAAALLHDVRLPSIAQGRR